MSALEAVEAEATAEDNVFTLVTELGEAEIVVPPVKAWRSSARHLLISMGDDYGWAKSTLSADDFAEWVRCDPRSDESAAFFSEVMAANGENLGKSGPSSRSSRSTRKR